MDVEVVADWHAFCRGERDVDSSQFLTLFHEGPDHATVANVVAYLANAEEVTRRVLAVAAGPDRGATPTDDELMRLSAGDVTAKRTVAVEWGEAELVGFIDSALQRVRTASAHDVDEARHGERHGLYIEVLGDHFADQVGPIVTEAGVDAAYAIKEAFYGMTTLFEISWFLSAPLRPPGVDVDGFFELWRLGGQYAIADGELLVARTAE